MSCRNIAPVAGGERELRTTYLRPFHTACLEALSIMTAYNSYDGIPIVSDKRELTPAFPRRISLTHPRRHTCRHRKRHACERPALKLTFHSSEKNGNTPIGSPPMPVLSTISFARTLPARLVSVLPRVLSKTAGVARWVVEHIPTLPSLVCHFPFFRTHS